MSTGVVSVVSSLAELLSGMDPTFGPSLEHRSRTVAARWFYASVERFRAATVRELVLLHYLPGLLRQLQHLLHRQARLLVGVLYDAAVVVEDHGRPQVGQI